MRASTRVSAFVVGKCVVWASAPAAFLFLLDAGVICWQVVSSWAGVVGVFMVGCFQRAPFRCQCFFILEARFICRRHRRFLSCVLLFAGVIGNFPCAFLFAGVIGDFVARFI